MTLFDFAASSLPSFATRSAAPGISRSITYFGMADPPRLDGADSMSASPALSGALGRKSRRRPYGRLASPMAAPRPVSAAEIESLAIGAWILGTGGGGSPYLALLNMRKLYREGAAVSLLDPMDLADDARVAVVSNMGAPLVGQERLTDPHTIARAVQMMEEYRGCRFDAVMSLEIGGGNALQPLMAAAVLGLPVVDADCMGRAFPEAQMTSFAIHDLTMYPLTLADVRDNAVIIARAASWKWMERLSRKACVEVGSIASTCKAPRTGKEVKECAILGSTSKAIGIGRAVQAARRAHRDPIEAVLEVEAGIKLFSGKIHDIARRTTEGFLRAP